jgi:hypothetical protein
MLCNRDLLVSGYILAAGRYKLRPVGEVGGYYILCKR